MPLDPTISERAITLLRKFWARGCSFDQCNKFIEDELVSLHNEVWEEAAKAVENFEVTLDGDDPFGNLQIAAGLRTRIIPKD